MHQLGGVEKMEIFCVAQQTAHIIHPVRSFVLVHFYFRTTAPCSTTALVLIVNWTCWLRQTHFSSEAQSHTTFSTHRASTSFFVCCCWLTQLNLLTDATDKHVISFQRPDTGSQRNLYLSTLLHSALPDPLHPHWAGLFVSQTPVLQPAAD